MTPHELAEHFIHVAESAYFRTPLEGWRYNETFFPQPLWRNPWEHITDTMENIGSLVGRDADVLCLREKLLLADAQAHLNEFFKQGEIDALSFYSHGDHAVVFEGRHKTDQSEARTVIRMGSEPVGRPWCPCVLGADISDAEPGFILESLPLVAMSDNYDAQSALDTLMQEMILKGTPFWINAGRDIGVLPGGTPIYVDADDMSLAPHRTIATEQDKQKAMAQMYENCRGLPEQFHFVAPLPNGDFVTRQELVFSCLRPPIRFVPETKAANSHLSLNG